MTQIPKRRDVHADPSGTLRIGEDMPEKLANSVEAKSPAKWAYERLILYIGKFEETLDNDQEVAMGFTGSDAGLLRIEGIGHFDPDMVTFYGSDQAGVKSQLIQHVTQLSVTLRAVPKPAAAPEPFRIGFRLAGEVEDEA